MNWISVNDERKPLFEQDVLIYAVRGNYEFIATGWYDDNGVFLLDSDYYFDSVTHWMPLPEPPKD